MSIETKIFADTPAEYFDCLRSLLRGDARDAAPTNVPQSGGPTPQPADKPKAEKPKAADKPKTEPTKAPEAPAAAPAASEKAYTLADIAEIVPKCAAKDRTRTVELLGKYGAKKGGELKPADYAAFIADANKFLAE